MAKKQKPSGLNRLAGKKVVFNGKFAYGEEERLKAMAEAQAGTLTEDLDAKTDYLVLADLNAGKTIQKKVVSLNGKGATIQVIDVEEFKKLAEPTEQEILEMLRSGEAEIFNKIFPRSYYHYALRTKSPRFNLQGENLNAVNLGNVDFDDIGFQACSFIGATLKRVSFESATECDFSDMTGEQVHFWNARGSRFKKAGLKQAIFEGDISGADFSGATLDEASFSEQRLATGHGKKPWSTPVFAKASLKSAKFRMAIHAPDFSGADLTGAYFCECALDAANFSRAKLGNAKLIDSTLHGADFTNADLTGANLGNSDLTGACFQGATLKNVSFRGAKLDNVDFSKAKQYDPNSSVTSTIGPALQELDKINKAAGRIQVTFLLLAADGKDDEHVGIDSSGLKWGWGIRLPARTAGMPFRSSHGPIAFSDAMLQLANLSAGRAVRFETVDVSSSKSPKSGKELRELVMQGIAEAFAQELPAAADLAATTKKYRDAAREKGAAARELQKQAKAEAEKQKEKANKQIAKKVEKAVGKVGDTASFLKALEIRIEKPKIDKATKMLKASGFKLFNDVTDQYVSGVVKSQTDPDLVYACRIEQDGQYACCTQNLNICGGLRGSICKHLLVLIIGLVQAGELDPSTIDAWIAKTHNIKAALDKENMGAIFIKYKGAEAGEVDWRPTETVPEDYYAL